ncbi:uroporphyrinogen-III synthase [Aurantiacibacter sp. MUD11]|uniref:uroporphyrinogen-III synthase n=1 Tax=Aurantiacibacter sp. MUD11 TaxID=3003265 RepID=UPI0022AB017C|nr:uroporphyrinogen-III synthase [Aurantiacibacter sp. MUD11]WAT17779.1 uroporphyrinogen-III synthase [Aurantiacibacter sp. MUD11]
MIFVIRPEPGLQSTLQAARERGLPAVGLPLFEVMPRNWDAPDAEQFDALLLGSANALRYGGDKLAQYQSLPVHAVGEATADAAREAGFQVAQTGEGGLQKVLDTVQQPTRFLRLAGVEKVPLTPPKGSTITTREVYEVRALPITGSAQVGLRAGDPLVLLHSAAAAQHFAAEVDRLGLDRGKMRLVCIGPRVEKAAGQGWAEVKSAPQPSDAELLALAADMCH